MRTTEFFKGITSKVYSLSIKEDLVVHDVERNLFDQTVHRETKILGIRFTRDFSKKLTFEIKDIPKSKDINSVKGFNK